MGERKSAFSNTSSLICALNLRIWKGLLALPQAEHADGCLPAQKTMVTATLMHVHYTQVAGEMLLWR